ncbi:hypothetical protein VARIO8X_50153 [Burkholderiales bacterium 8X]|nr:hypothetical protein VARIO8X_50153 [Burkholderiales bacterium 8X]
MLPSRSNHMVASYSLVSSALRSYWSSSCLTSIWLASALPISASLRSGSSAETCARGGWATSRVAATPTAAMAMATPPQAARERNDCCEMKVEWSMDGSWFVPRPEIGAGQRSEASVRKPGRRNNCALVLSRF